MRRVAREDGALGLVPRSSSFSVSEARLLSHLALLCGLLDGDEPILLMQGADLLKSWFPWYARLRGDSERDVLFDLFFLADRRNEFVTVREEFIKMGNQGVAENTIEGLASRANSALDMLLRNATSRASGEEGGASEDTSTLRRNATPYLLWTLLQRQYAQQRKETFPLLRYLSRYRMHNKFKTVWESEMMDPNVGADGDGDDESILTLLKLVRDTRAPSPERLPVCAALALVIRELAAALLEDTSLLDSPPYRKLLWQNLDAVVWYVITRGLAEELKLDFAHLPVPPIPSPEKYLWLIAEFGYVVLGVDRDLRIYEHFRRAAQHEVLLYHSRTEYRDHLFHAVETFLVGYALLRGNRSPVESIFSANGNSPGDTETLREWFLAALFHDFGYVMELVPLVTEIAQQFPIDGIREMVPELKNQWDDKITELNRIVKEQQGLKSEIGKKRTDHGVFSYLHLRSELLRLDPLARKELSLSGPPSKWKSKHCKRHAKALSAILKHNLSREPVNVRKEPLSALLILCDELQEWRRPRYNMWELTQSAMASIHNRELGNATIRRVCETVIFENCSCNDGRIDFPSKDFKIILRYADQNLNRFDPVIRLLYKVYNLERIEALKTIGVVLEIQMRRLRRKPRRINSQQGRLEDEQARLEDEGVSELDILRDFCLLHEVGVGYELFTRRPAMMASERCIRSETPDNSPPLDVIRLDMRAFDKKPRSESPLVPIPPWEFEQQWFNFKREFCQRKDLDYAFVGDDEEWGEQQITTKDREAR